MSIGPAASSLVNSKGAHERVILTLGALYPFVHDVLHAGGLCTVPRQLGGVSLPHRSWQDWTRQRVRGKLVANALRTYRYATSPLELESMTGEWQWLPTT